MTKKSKMFLPLAIIILLLSGCNSGNGNLLSNESESKVTFIDSFNREVSVPKNPQRIVVLNASNLELVYALGKEAVARTKTSSELPEKAQALPEVGSTSKPDVEAIISYEPDLVIGAVNNTDLIAALEEAHIPVVLLKGDNFAETLEVVDKMGVLLNSQKESQAIIDKVNKNTQDIISKIPSDSPKVLILFGSSKRYMVGMPNSFVGDIVNMLGGQNVAENEFPLEGEVNYAAFSLEAIVKWNPDVILALGHGDPTIMEQKLKEDLEQQDAWKELRAVKENKVYLLPFDMFTVKPGQKLDGAVLYIAKLLYPDSFE